ncbi:MAG: SpoIIE family protein phosphatase, partial [Bacteroidales bacterium]|nr:SpoIIE family protein phosphatase [Bacteroidales bacterium]
ETANRKILESINYAQRIQNAAISSQKEIDELFGNNFVFYRPRNIVSGDFYRAVRCGRYSVMITADCTGHGIPGAFLSMLGISALKEYMTTEDDAQNPGIVLDKMRSFIKSTLNAEKDDSPSDGMEMTVCCLDLEQMEMKFAIANQTAYIVRQGKPITLRGDSMTIGKSIIESKNFKTQSMPIQHGDMLYMFSDGI